MIVNLIVEINTKQADKQYTYLVPEKLENEISIGDKVTFPFGKKNTKKSGYVISIDDNPIKPEYELKTIYDIQKKAVSIEKNIIKIAMFLKKEYGCTYAQAFNTVMPIKEKVTPKSKVEILSSLNKIQDDIVLTDEQKDAFNNILSSNNNKFLIHGVTGSGKTQVFIELAKHVINKGKQVIILIPEIALTYQMVSRFIEVFGDRVGIINSRLNKGEKYEYIRRAIDNEIDIIIGPRSALFTPFNNIGCIIIDEEHESSYKSEQMPKYETSKVAEYISDMHNSLLVLASATPSIASYYKALNGQFKLIELKNRVKDIELPRVEIVDMREEVLDGNTEIFSKYLIDSIQKTLDEKKQVLLFVSRRGYSNYLICLNCSTPLVCKNCDVSYTYHNDSNTLKCHYCDSSIKVPKKCPECGSSGLYKVGYGTQKVEEKLKMLFPDYKVIRMDHDTTRNKYSYEKILKKFHNHDADILVGTQMIIKGHDFSDVALVGILQIDNTINLPTYIASEEAFQVIVQASGRAGRSEGGGKAIIQTFQPEHYSIVCAKNNDYKSFYKLEISYRTLMKYPPVLNMIKITVSDKNEEKVDFVIKRIKNYIEKSKKENTSILGPSKEGIYKINSIYRQNLYIKGDDKVINYIIRVCEYVRFNDDYCKFISITYDINPTM